jgi:uncharacterized protein DUF6328
MADDSKEPDADEQFSALLEGLRATLPGVEVLFGFLLVLPFQQGFAKLDDVEKKLYAVALTSAGIALILLIAPSVHQRVRAPFSGLPRHHVRHVKVGAYLGIGGSVAGSIALIASTWLALTVVYGNGVAITLGVVVALLLAWSWFWIPLVNFNKDHS